MPKKNNHTHKTVFTWFDNLPTSTELQDFTIIKEKIQVRQYSFSFSQKTMAWASAPWTRSQKISH